VKVGSGGSGGGSSGNAIVFASRLSPDIRIPPKMGAGLCWEGGGGGGRGAEAGCGGGWTSARALPLGGGGGGGGRFAGLSVDAASTVSVEGKVGRMPPPKLFTKLSLLLTLATASIWRRAEDKPV